MIETLYRILFDSVRGLLSLTTSKAVSEDGSDRINDFLFFCGYNCNIASRLTHFSGNGKNPIGSEKEDKETTHLKIFCTLR